MSARSYKYHIDRKTLIRTIVHFVLFAAVGLLIWYMYVGGYFSAWFISLIVAIIALMALSIPRRIVVDEQALTIVCLLEIVEINMQDIVSVRRVDRRECQWMIPLVASRGFFGYYGFYLDINTFDRVCFYATEWQNLVEIVDAYDDRYYVSCRSADELVDQIGGYITSADQGETEEL